MSVRIVCFREDEPKYELDPGLHKMMVDATYSVVRIYPFSPTTGENGQFKGWVLSFDTQAEFDSVDINALVDRIEDQLVTRAMLTDRPMDVDLSCGDIAMLNNPRGRTVLYSVELDEGVSRREEELRIGSEEHEAMLAVLHETGADLHVLDELVQDAKAAEASDINNLGMHEQIEYLRKQGFTAQDLRQEFGAPSPTLSN